MGESIPSPMGSLTCLHFDPSQDNYLGMKENCEEGSQNQHSKMDAILSPSGLMTKPTISSTKRAMNAVSETPLKISVSNSHSEGVPLISSMQWSPSLETPAISSDQVRLNWGSTSPHSPVPLAVAAASSSAPSSASSSSFHSSHAAGGRKKSLMSALRDNHKTFADVASRSTTPYTPNRTTRIDAGQDDDEILLLPPPISSFSDSSFPIPSSPQIGDGEERSPLDHTTPPLVSSPSPRKHKLPDEFDWQQTTPKLTHTRKSQRRQTLSVISRKPVSQPRRATLGGGFPALPFTCSSSGAGLPESLTPVLVGGRSIHFNEAQLEKRSTRLFAEVSVWSSAPKHTCLQLPESMSPAIPSSAASNCSVSANIPRNLDLPCAEPSKEFGDTAPVPASGIAMQRPLQESLDLISGPENLDYNYPSDSQLSFGSDLPASETFATPEADMNEDGELPQNLYDDASYLPLLRNHVVVLEDDLASEDFGAAEKDMDADEFGDDTDLDQEWLLQASQQFRMARAAVSGLASFSEDPIYLPVSDGISTDQIAMQPLDRTALFATGHGKVISVSKEAVMLGARIVNESSSSEECEGGIIQPLCSATSLFRPKSLSDFLPQASCKANALPSVHAQENGFQGFITGSFKPLEPLSEETKARATALMSKPLTDSFEWIETPIGPSPINDKRDLSLSQDMMLKRHEKSFDSDLPISVSGKNAGNAALSDNHLFREEMPCTAKLGGFTTASFKTLPPVSEQARIRAATLLEPTIIELKSSALNDSNLQNVPMTESPPSTSEESVPVKKMAGLTTAALRPLPPPLDSSKARVAALWDDDENEFNLDKRDAPFLVEASTLCKSISESRKGSEALDSTPLAVDHFKNMEMSNNVEPFFPSGARIRGFTTAASKPLPPPTSTARAQAEALFTKDFAPLSTATGMIEDEDIDVSSIAQDLIGTPLEDATRVSLSHSDTEERRTVKDSEKKPTGLAFSGNRLRFRPPSSVTREPLTTQIPSSRTSIPSTPINRSSSKSIITPKLPTSVLKTTRTPVSLLTSASKNSFSTPFLIPKTKGLPSFKTPVVTLSAKGTSNRARVLPTSTPSSRVKSLHPNAKLNITPSSVSKKSIQTPSGIRDHTPLCQLEDTGRISMVQALGPVLMRKQVQNLYIHSSSASEYLFTVQSGDSLCKMGVDDARAALIEKGVSPNLASIEWVRNHYRWIVWKLACLDCYEVDTSLGLAPFLSWESVLHQLCYRYEKEINMVRRSCLKLIIERDNRPSRMILCVSDIKRDSEHAESCRLELTDGWYCITAVIDTDLQAAVNSGKIFIGQKLDILNCQFDGSADGCAALEINHSSTYLRLNANATRRARWYTRLGYHQPSFGLISLDSISPTGGQVAVIDVVVLRVYPLKYMESYPDGSKVTRLQKEEERAAAEWQKVFAKNYERLWEETQRSALLDVATSNQDLQEAQEEVTAQMEDEVPERKVSPFITCLVTDYPPSSVFKSRGSRMMFTIWQPTDMVISVLKEGHRLQIFNLLARSRNGKTLLTSMKTSRYYSRGSNEEVLQAVGYVPRSVCTDLSDLDWSESIDGHLIIDVFLVLASSGPELDGYRFLDAGGNSIVVYPNHINSSIFKPASVIYFKNLSVFKQHGTVRAKCLIDTEPGTTFKTPEHLALKAQLEQALS